MPDTQLSNTRIAFINLIFGLGLMTAFNLVCQFAGSVHRWWTNR